MHKRIALISLAIVMVFAMVSVASAATAPKAMTNTTQKGSLLIFPKIIVQDLGENDAYWKDTVIFLSNDNPAQVWVQCYWMDENQTVEDFNFKLTPNQPIVFSAQLGMNIPVLDPPVTVPPFLPGDSGVGALFCWAVNDDDSSAKSYNHLYGNAMILSGKGDNIGGTVLYNAYSFVAYFDNPAGTALPLPVATDGTQTLPLDGLKYDACPSYLLANFTTAGEFINPDVETSLTLVPCKQDLTQERKGTYTKAKFDIWNANETKFTGAYQCFKCFAEFQLDDIGNLSGSKTKGSTGKVIGKGFGGDKFMPWVLKTFANRFRVYGVPSDGVCGYQGSTYTGLLALLLYEDRPFLTGDIHAGTTLHGAGLANKTSGATADAGFIKWDTGSGSQEAKGK